MKKLAIIVNGSFDKHRGQENAELNRIKHLKDIWITLIPYYNSMTDNMLSVCKLQNGGGTTPWIYLSLFCPLWWLQSIQEFTLLSSTPGAE